MIIDVWDLTCRMRYSRWQDCTEADARVVNQGQLREEVIYPRGEADNRTPYLQNYRQPNIADFYDANGRLNFDNAFFLEDMLHDLEIDNEDVMRSNAQHWRDYFRLEAARLREKIARYDEADSIVLVVPDSLSPLAQTRLLRYCGMPSGRVRLLWTSIAAALGAEEQYALLPAGSTLMVVLPQKHYGYGVQLELTQVSRQNTRIIPRRRCFQADSKYYPQLNAFKKTLLPYGGNTQTTYDFVLHAYGNSQRAFILPVRNGNWRLVDNFPALQYASVKLSNIAANCVIVPGITPVEINSRVKILSDKQDLSAKEERKDFISRGAARFAVRKANHLPTYFDQCERLSIIIQDSQRETIEAHTLIEPQDSCDGGEIVLGKVNTDSYLPPQNSVGKFYLAMGEVHNSTPLKYLEQDFGCESLHEQRLTMRSSMLPGQGVAQVSVEGAPLFKQAVELDFLNMQNCKETLQSLSEQLKRSFPIDMPAVKASRTLWNLSDWDIQLYLDRGLLSGNEIFARRRKINQFAAGLDSLECENVFGNHESYRIPAGISPQTVKTLFTKLAEDYERIRRRSYNSENDLNLYLRPIAWSYHPEFPLFKQIVHDIVDELSNTLSGAPVMHTLCANLLTDTNDLRKYLNAWIDQTDNLLEEHPKAELKKSSWNRSLHQILIFNNDALKEMDNALCYDIVDRLCKLLDLKSSGEPAYKQVLLALLFMLKRRKYDHGFLREEKKSVLFNTVLIQMAEFCRKRARTQPANCGICKMIEEFLNGNGTLEGLPALINGMDGNGGANASVGARGMNNSQSTKR